MSTITTKTTQRAGILNLVRRFRKSKARHHTWPLGFLSGISMRVPMAAWMLYPKMGWRHTRDMSIASLIGAMLPVGAWQLGYLPLGATFPPSHAPRPALPCYSQCIGSRLIRQFLIVKQNIS